MAIKRPKSEANLNPPGLYVCAPYFHSLLVGFGQGAEIVRLGQALFTHSNTGQTFPDQTICIQG